jgi:NAD(P)-dependent dehydrogenase (short-subunit alcohol dehydrogenase family)
MTIARSVLITGCSTGIGHATAARPAASEFGATAAAQVDADDGPYAAFNASVAKSTREVYRVVRGSFDL